MTCTRVFPWIFGATVALSVGVGCTETLDEPAHCWNAKGDATCEMELGNEQTWYCTTSADPCGVEAPLGCVTERPAADECYSPCGGKKSFIEQSECFFAGDESGDESGGEDGGPLCGNSVVDSDEGCDDGNDVDDDGCTNSCKLAVCGDGIVQLGMGEECDGGGAGCLADCSRPGGRLNELTSFEDASAGYVVAVGANKDVFVVNQREQLFWLTRFSGDFAQTGLNEVSLPSLPNLGMTQDGGLIVGGAFGLKAQAKRFEADGSSPWNEPVVNGDANSSIVSIASAADHLVVSGTRDSFDKPGLLARLDASTGQTDWTETPTTQLGLVAVDNDGEIFVIGAGQPPKLLRFSKNNDAKPVVELPAANYEDIIVTADGGLYLLARTPEHTSFHVSKYSVDGVEQWSSPPYQSATASGLALLPSGAVVVAGRTTDRSSAVLAWYDETDGELLHDRADIKVDGQAMSYFHDVAVEPTGEFAVAVGAAGMAPDTTKLWIYKFEI